MELIKQPEKYEVTDEYNRKIYCSYNMDGVNIYSESDYCGWFNYGTWLYNLHLSESGIINNIYEDPEYYEELINYVTTNEELLFALLPEEYMKNNDNVILYYLSSVSIPETINNIINHITEAKGEGKE